MLGIQSRVFNNSKDYKRYKTYTDFSDLINKRINLVAVLIDTFAEVMIVSKPGEHQREIEGDFIMSLCQFIITFV